MRCLVRLIVLIATSDNLLLLPHLKVLKNGFRVRYAIHLLPSYPDHLRIKRVGFADGLTRGSRLGRLRIEKLLLQLVVYLVVFWVLLGLSFNLALLNLLANLLVLVLEPDHVEAQQSNPLSVLKEFGALDRVVQIELT